MLTVFGDSHTKIFSYINEVAEFNVFRVVCVPGATALGAVRPDSKTNALSKFREVFRDKSLVISKLIIQLGEVDCGFLVWLLAQKRGGTSFKYLKRSINNLSFFVEEVLDCRSELKPSDINIISVPYSIGVDVQSRKFLHGLRSEVSITKIQIDEAIDFYNNGLKSICVKKGYRYIDATNIYCTYSKSIYPLCLPSSKYEHHLNFRYSWGLLLSALLGEKDAHIRESRNDRFKRQSMVNKIKKNVEQYAKKSKLLINVIRRIKFNL